MLVVTRFRVPVEDVASFRDDLMTAHEALAACRGYLDGTVGRNVDELYRAVDEPSAYEVVDPGTDLNVASARSLG